MSVLLETSLGDIVLDLHAEDCPNTCRNFLKLCKAKRYNGCLFFDVQRDFLVQTGDPTNRGTGGDSIYGVLYGPQARFFEHEIRLPRLNHSRKGTVGMASAGEHLNASQFYITTGTSLNRLDGQHTVFGEVAEGMDTVERINESLCDENGRPWQNIRIKHTFVLDDPFPDPPGMEDVIPDKSPVWKPDPDDNRLEEDWRPEDEGKDPEDLERRIREQEAKSRAVVLEMIGDLPSADAVPPENVLFVCKLNPVTSDEDLEIIFSRFGKILSCDVIRDKKTGESLCYGFIAYDNSKSAEDAYFKMNNVLIDDRRIHVDFSQSVSHLWKQHSRQAIGVNPGHGEVSRSGIGGTTRGKLDMRGNPLESRLRVSSHKILLDPDKVKESQAWSRSKSELSHSKSREYEVGFPKHRRDRPSSSSHEDRRDRHYRDEWKQRHDDPYERRGESYLHNKSRSHSRRETHHTVRHEHRHRSRSRERYRDAPRYRR